MGKNRRYTHLRSLAVVSNRYEAEQVLEYAKNENTIIMALGLEAEFYLKSKLINYVNHLYLVLDRKSSDSNHTFLLPHFELAYSWYNNEYYDYIRDRFGYFLTEIDRSYEFVRRAIRKFRPDRLLIGELKGYKGASVMNGSLKTNAFYLYAKEHGISYKLLDVKSQKVSVRGFAGRILKSLSLLRKQKSFRQYDLLVLANPRHLIQLPTLIAGIEKLGISVGCLTYNLTLDYKLILDKLYGQYMVKEKIITSQMEQEARAVKQALIRNRHWMKFEYLKYKGNKTMVKFLRNKLEDIVKTEMDEVLVDEVLANRLLAKIKPKALLTTTDPDTKALTFIKTAKKKGIKTIALQHGVLFWPAPLAVCPVSNHFIVWSNISKRWIFKISDFKSSKVYIGQSLFHTGFRLKKTSVEKKEIKILLLATIITLDSDLIAYYQKKLFLALDKMNLDIKLTVRIHPFQNASNLGALINNCRITANFDTNRTLAESIGEADVVIYEETTAGFDAMLARKPTVFFNPYTGRDYFEVTENKASLAILNEKEIDSKLTNFLRDRETWGKYGERGRFFAERYLGINKSGGEDKNVKIIGKIIGVLSK